MSNGPAESSLDQLLEQLHRGDPAAAEQVFKTYEPYLRVVIRRQLTAELRAKFDSLDIVQSVWADTLRGFRQAAWKFKDAGQLRAFLITAARNRLIDRCRQNRAGLAKNESLTACAEETLPATNQPRPSEEAQAGDLWEKLLTMCPPAHHELLALKRDGVPLDTIAAQTGLHKSSVRRIISELARKLAEHEAAQAQASESQGRGPSHG